MVWINRIEKDDWIKQEGWAAHASAFGTSRPDSLERFDYALVSMKGDKPTGYVTCIEMDSETLYWQIGGAFSSAQKSTVVVPCYKAMIDWCADKYQRITTRIENDNISMLHLAQKMGFRVVGTWNFKNKIYLELLLEKGT